MKMADENSPKMELLENLIESHSMVLRNENRNGIAQNPCFPNPAFKSF